MVDATVTTELSFHLLIFTVLSPIFPVKVSEDPRGFFSKHFTDVIGHELSNLFALMVPVPSYPKFFS